MAVILLMQFLLFAGLLFVPTFVIAFTMLRSAYRAFVLSAWFSLGATGGGLVAYVVSSVALTRRHSTDINAALTGLFVLAGAAAGGVLAVFVLNRLSKYPPWRRY